MTRRRAGTAQKSDRTTSRGGLNAQLRAARNRGDFEEAERLLRGALATAPDNPGLLHHLVLNLKDQGRLQEAEDVARRAVAGHPRSTDLGLDLTAILATRGRLDEAEKVARKAVEEAPDSALAWLVLGNMRYQVRALDGAAHAYRRVCELAPSDPIGPLMQARTRSLQYHDEEAADLYVHAYRLLTARRDGHSPLTRRLYERFTGDVVVYDADALKGRQHMPARVLLVYIIESLMKANRLDEAVEWGVEHIARAPDYGPAFYDLGKVHYFRRDYAAAAAPLTHAIRLMPRDVRPAFLLASCLWQQGDREEAVRVCARSLVWFASSVSRPTLDNRAEDREADTRVTIPWNMRMYLFSGLFHPLINEVTQETFDGFSLEYPLARQHITDLHDSCARMLEHFAAVREWLEQECPQVSAGHLFAFLESRHFLSQILADNPAHDFSVLHTAPHTLNQTPWLLHVEVPLTLFYPFVSYGKTRDLRFEDSPYYALVKAYLESDHCLGIFSHLKSTCEALPRLFHNPALADKVHEFPLATPALAATCAAKQSDRGGPIRILFTGSFNEDTWSFYSRGGLYVVEAFLTLAEEFPDLELVLRANVPTTLEADLLDRITSHPRISVVTQRLSERELQALYDSADIMALPSYTLHCQSVFRAMASGCVCVVSDAPDYRQFLRDGENGVIAGGRLGEVYQFDAELGIVREHYPNMRQFDPVYALSVTAAFRRLLTDRAFLATLRANARAFLETDYPRSGMVETFGRLLTMARSHTRSLQREQASYLSEGAA